MSAYKITPADIIESYAKNGNDLVNIIMSKEVDKTMKRYFNDKVCYIKMQFKIGEEYFPPTLLFTPTVIPAGIIGPATRQYTGINIPLSEEFTEPTDPKLVGKIKDSQVGRALSIIYEAVEAQLKKLVDNKIISEERRDAKTAVIFPSVRFGCSRREGSDDKNNKGEIKLFDSPRYYISIPLKDKKADVSTFSIPLYKISKKEKVEVLNADGNQYSTEDIHEYVTSGSIITGCIKFELVGSALKINLKGEFMNELIIKTCVSEGYAKKLPDDHLNMMGDLDSDSEEESKTSSLVSQMKNKISLEESALDSDDDDEE
jgi:hypothetical protein